MSPYQGVAGRVVFDGLGSNTRLPQIGTIQDGRAVADNVKR